MTSHSTAGLASLPDRLRPRLQFLYGLRAEEILSRIMQVCARFDGLPKVHRAPAWNERDTVLITYADQIRSGDKCPLAALREFLHKLDTPQMFRLIHLLPFYPATSDDGFSVVDYREVDADFGGWDDIARLGERFDLMFDLVLNHISVSSDWFRKYLAGVEPCVRYFVEGHPGDDLSAVVRPRTSPLLTPFETSRGERNVWTTFSADQVDLNYREPGVLVEMLDVLLGYIRNGARIVRLDAVAFLWKEPGTTCLHLPQTHEIVKLIRDIVDALAPGTLLLTETNVPHSENASYWGNSDEAHLIYNFSLPPLLLDALLSGDATFLDRWLRDSSPPPPGAAMLNFTSSHDGIGVRPLESLVPPERIDRLVAAVQQRGGLVSRRAGPDGRDIPYELNITYFDALGDPDAPYGDSLHVRRFMTSQALMLSFRGIPAVYFPSLFGAPNYLEGVQRTGRARTINRRKYELAELQTWLSPESPHGQVWTRYQALLKARANESAFHPDGRQDPLFCNNPAIVSFVRTSPEMDRAILVVANVSRQRQRFRLKDHSLKIAGADIISGVPRDEAEGVVMIQPCEVLWLPVHQQSK